MTETDPQISKETKKYAKMQTNTHGGVCAQMETAAEKQRATKAG